MSPVLQFSLLKKIRSITPYQPASHSRVCFRRRPRCRERRVPASRHGNAPGRRRTPTETRERTRASSKPAGKGPGLLKKPGLCVYFYDVLIGGLNRKGMRIRLCFHFISCGRFGSFKISCIIIKLLL